ncbi:2OG-Fe dioxygenase family protein [Rhizobacter sp. LjRoot28]|uniref:2OG-Fe dioxygenase family protein n=1 Tax=Rhizobacter sp. LjRoot28 TaxID=3342309 RepID=UPI003ECFB56A
MNALVPPPTLASSLAPPYAAPLQLGRALAATGHAVVSPAGLCALLDTELPTLTALQPTWDDLPADAYLRDGGRYRRRRHACFIVDDQQVERVPHRAHWQPVEYNALHGGIERLFEPMTEAVLAQPVWARLLVQLSATCSALRGARPWFVEAHQFRIDTTDGIGRPTPEGAHRDGVDFVAVILVDRRGVKGGETRVFEANGPHGIRFTLTEPWTLLMLDDAKVIHESTPILPTAPDGHRDTLVLTFRSAGFQGPSAEALVPAATAPN